LSDIEIRQRLEFDDRDLLRECRLEAYRASGPGGQRRNKVSTAVRLRHEPSGICVTASESRSQNENRLRALRRLREAIALQIRLPVRHGRPHWPPCVHVRNGRLRVSESNPAYPQVVAIVLDTLEACRGEPKPAARRLGLTTSSLLRFAYRHPKVWQALTHIRMAYGLPVLRAPR